MNAPWRSRLSPIEMDARLFRWPPDTVMVMLYGFVDESGEFDQHSRLRRLTLGGFIARWVDVKQLCVKWRAALDDECLAEFHMKKIASDEYDFENWPPERQKRLDRFIEILCDHAIRFFGFNYSVQKLERAFRDAYDQGLAHVMTNTAQVAVNEKEQVRLFFAKTDEISGAMIGRYFDLVNWPEKHIRSYTLETCKLRKLSPEG